MTDEHVQTQGPISAETGKDAHTEIFMAPTDPPPENEGNESVTPPVNSGVNQ